MLTAPPPLPGSPQLLRTLGEEPWAVGGFDPNEPFVASRDGRLLAGAFGRIVWVLRAADGVVLHRLTHPHPSTRSVFFSPSGDRLYVYSGGALLEFSTDDGALVRSIEGLPFNGRGALSPDGAYLVAHGLEIALLDARDGAVLARHACAPPNVGARTAPLFSSDGRYALAVDASLVRIDLATRTFTSTSVVEWSAWGTSVGPCAAVLATPDSLVRVDLTDGHLGERVTHRGIGDVTASGDRLYAHVRDVHDPPTRAWLQLDSDTLQAAPGVTSPRTNDRDRVVVSGETLWLRTEGRVHRRALTPATPEALSLGARGRCNVLRFSPDGAHLSAVFGTYYGHSALRWELATGLRVGAFEGSRPVRLSPDGARCAGALALDDDRFVRMTLTPDATPEPLAAGRSANDEVALGDGDDAVILTARSLTFVASGAVCAVPPKLSLCDDPEWNVARGLLVSRSHNRLAVYDVANSQFLPTISTGNIEGFAMRGGEAWVAGDTSVTVWDLATRARSQKIKVPLAKTEKITSLAVTPDGRRLAVGTSAGHAVVMDLTDSTRTARVAVAQTGSVTACALSPDGAHLATGGDESLVRVWDVAAVFEAAVAPSVVSGRRGRA